jgi:hypothetical protein
MAPSLGPDPRPPALAPETLEDFLAGRLRGEERARVLATLKNLPDDDFMVFTEAAAVLRELEHESLAARLMGWVARIISRLRRSRPTDPPSAESQ